MFPFHIGMSKQSFVTIWSSAGDKVKLRKHYMNIGCFAIWVRRMKFISPNFVRLDHQMCCSYRKHRRTSASVSSVKTFS